MRTLLRSSLPLLFVIVTGCAGNTSGSDASETAAPAENDPNVATLVVSNRTNSDMDIYAMRTGGAARVGFAPASETTTFKLPPGMLAGAGGIRFEARPAQASGQSVLSEPYNTTPGQQITWDIPPQ